MSRTAVECTRRVVAPVAAVATVTMTMMGGGSGSHSSSMWSLCMTRCTNGASTREAAPIKSSPEKRA
jgi:hypothetical protein